MNALKPAVPSGPEAKEMAAIIVRAYALRRERPGLSIKAAMCIAAREAEEGR